MRSTPLRKQGLASRKGRIKSRFAASSLLQPCSLHLLSVNSQIKQAESLFDVVDEEEYAKIVSKRRQDDFVEDDEGIIPNRPCSF